jgi:hypothetical protein
LAFVATGIGVVGFVTFFGGAILWVRAREAGLPANDSVAVIPKGVLVTTGASFLVPAVLIALLAVGLVYAVHLGLYLPQRLRARDESRKAARLEYEAEQAALSVPSKQKLAESARALATDLHQAHQRASQGPGAAPGLAGLTAQASAQEQEAQKREQDAREASSVAAELAADAQAANAEREFALKISPKVDAFQRGVEIAVAFLILALLPLLVDQSLFHVGFLRALILIVVAVAAAVVSLVTYIATERFLWFGVVAFVTVSVFIGCATYFRTVKDPKVEPVAALRGDRPPITGVFVAESADDLYLGTFEAGQGGKRLVIVPRSQLTDLSVGPLMRAETAQERALALAIDACSQKIEKADRHGKAVSAKPACSKGQRSALVATP